MIIFLIFACFNLFFMLFLRKCSWNGIVAIQTSFIIAYFFLFYENTRSYKHIISRTSVQRSRFFVYQKKAREIYMAYINERQKSRKNLAPTTVLLAGKTTNAVFSQYLIFEDSNYDGIWLLPLKKDAKMKNDIYYINNDAVETYEFVRVKSGIPDKILPVSIHAK